MIKGLPLRDTGHSGTLGDICPAQISVLSGHSGTLGDICPAQISVLSGHSGTCVFRHVPCPANYLSRFGA